MIWNEIKRNDGSGNYDIVKTGNDLAGKKLINWEERSVHETGNKERSELLSGTGEEISRNDEGDMMVYDLE